MRLSVCPIFLLTCEHDIKHDLWTRYCEHVTSPNKWTDFSDSWHKCSTVNFGGQDVKEQGHARPRIDLGAWRRHHSWPSWVELAFLVIPSPDWPADALCSRVVRLSVGVFVRLSVKNCEYDILKTDEPILMQTGISGPWGTDTKDQLWNQEKINLGSESYRSRSHEAKNIFGRLGAVSFWTQWNSFFIFRSCCHHFVVMLKLAVTCTCSYVPIYRSVQSGNQQSWAEFLKRSKKCIKGRHFEV